MTTKAYRLSNDNALVCFQREGSRRVEVKVLDLDEKEEFISLFHSKLLFLKILMGSEFVGLVKEDVPSKSPIPITIKKFSDNIEVEHELGSPNIRFKSAGERKVLIVDDSRTMRTILSKSIDAMPGYSVLATAESSVEARKIIEEQRPDIITLDLHMPGENGVEFLNHIWVSTYSNHSNHLCNNG